MRQRLPWFPGYSVLGVATLAHLASAPGQTFIVSQLNLPLRHAFDLSALSLNTSYTLATVLAALPLVWLGRLTDRVGPRRMLAAISLFFGLGCVLMSSAQGLLTVFLGFFALRFFGQGALTMVGQHAVAMWFHQRLGRVVGFKMVTVFGLWILAPQLALVLINSVGWRGTYVVFALGIWLLLIPAALLLVRDRPEEHGYGMDGERALSQPKGGGTQFSEPAFTLRQALGTQAYWTLAAALLIPPLVGTALIFDMQPLLGERGLSPENAAFAISSWTATMGLAALPAGALTDRLPARRMIAAGMSCMVVGPLLFLLVKQPWHAAAAMVLFALGQALVASAANAAVARFFGRTHHGAIRSSLSRIAIIGTGLGPLFTGISVAATGSYVMALWFFAVLAVPVAAVALVLAEPSLRGATPP